MLVTRISPGRRFGRDDLRELWLYRDLLWILAARDIKIRYKQTVVGVAWAAVQPLATMGIFTVLFTLLGRSPTSSHVPYALTALTALLPWQLFANSVTLSARSLVTHQALIRKVYFPRIFVPMAPLLCGMVDFLVALPILIGMMLLLGVPPSSTLLALPVLVLLVLALATAVGLWLSAMNALYRDVQHALPFLIQIWFFLSPVIYESEGFVPDRWQPLLALNPMTGLIEAFRWAALGTPFPTTAFSISLAITLLATLGGVFYFRRMERTFVDWV